MRCIALCAWLVCCIAPLTAQVSQLAAPLDLRCEGRTDPLAIDADAPQLTWRLAPASPALRNVVPSAFHVVVYRGAEDGGSEVLWDSGIVDSNAQFASYGGRQLAPGETATWRVCAYDAASTASPWSAPAQWSAGRSDFAARWIGAPPPAEDVADEHGVYAALPAALLRREFSVTGKIRRARLWVTALGLYELWLDGQRVGDAALAPGWTDYHRRVHYQTHDVTAQLGAGKHAFGVCLGDGWFAGRVGLAPHGRRAIYGRHPALLLRLEVEHADGSSEVVVSDDSWQVTSSGPIRSADLLDGESYDARREARGFDTPGFDATAWSPAHEFDRPNLQLVAEPLAPIRAIERIRPVACNKTADGDWTFDFGQNLAGRCELRVRGEAGATVRLRHAEVLAADGTIYTANLRAAAQTDTYVLRGGDEEVWAPRFTCHGFRYVAVSGLPSAPTADTLTALVLHSALPPAGEFVCSDALLTKLWQNIRWTQRANMGSVPTDCPQRDERCGWSGDILAFAPTACFNYDMQAFLAKWLQDLRDDQADDGRFPDFAPQPYDANARFSGVPAWGDAGTFVPWTHWLHYGDRRTLAAHYPAAKRWIDWIHAANPNLLWLEKRHNDYGDWLNADTLQLADWPRTGAEVPKAVFATMFFARSTELVARMAAVLDHADDAAHYRELAAAIRAAFVKAFVDADGVIQGDTQAGYALALAFELLPPERQAAALQHMLARFAAYGGHLSTGFHSTAPLLIELSQRGHVAEAYRVATLRTMPSWGYQIDHGATTVWERWDGFVEGRGYQDAGMNSFSHYALGSVGEWLYRCVLGIAPDEAHPGFARFTVRPRPGPLQHARGSHQCARGTIRVDWQQHDGTFELHVEVPVNTVARIGVPTTDPASVRAHDQARPLAPEADCAWFEVGSGMWSFTAAR